MKNDKLFDLEIYIVKLKYNDTTPPFKMEIRQRMCVKIQKITSCKAKL